MCIVILSHIRNVWAMLIDPVEDATISHLVYLGLILVIRLTLQQWTDLPCPNPTFRHKLAQRNFKEEHWNATKNDTDEVRKQECT